MGGGTKSDDDNTEENTGPLVGRVLAGPDERRVRRELPAIARRGRLAAELKNWGDRYPFLGGVKSSTTLVDPEKFSLIVQYPCRPSIY
jgi:hypothetical protein